MRAVEFESLLPDTNRKNFIHLMKKNVVML